MSLANSDPPVLSPETIESQNTMRPAQDAEKGFDSRVGQLSAESKKLSAFNELG